MNKKTGKIVVKHAYIAQNNGITVNLEGVTTQMSGALIQGLSRAMLEQVTLNKDRVTSLDWVSYPILRFKDSPKVTLVNVHPGKYTTVDPGRHQPGREGGQHRSLQQRLAAHRARASRPPRRSARRSRTRSSTRRVRASASRR